MTVKVTDYGKGVDSVSLILYHGSVLGFHPDADKFQFSCEAWKFFKKKFDDLLKRDDRYKPNQHKYFEERVQSSIVSERDEYSLSIYPGAHTGEWFVRFKEENHHNNEQIVLTLRDATGRGSTDYADDIREMLNVV